MAAVAAPRSRPGRDAEIEFYANSDKFPELTLDKDTIREIKASWMMFIALKGGPEAAEDAICKTLQKAEPNFAQMLYPDKANPRHSAKGQLDRVTGKVTNGREVKQHMAQIMKATQGDDAASGGGGCPFAAASGGLGGALGDLDGGFDEEEMREVMKIVMAANAKAKAAPPAPGQRAGGQERESRPEGRSHSAAAARGRSKPKKSSAKARAASSSSAPEHEQRQRSSASAAAARRAATPSGKSTAESRRVSL